MAKKTNSVSDIVGDRPLKDKVVLLLNGASAEGHSLAVSLAEEGADIAIVYRHNRAGQARETKHSVEVAGRRCLIIQSQTDDGTFAKKVIRKTINRLGRLDIFIDYSSLPDDQLRNIDDVVVAERTKAAIDLIEA